MTTMKRCIKCLCDKPLTEFHRHSWMPDGHVKKCKACTNADASQNRQNNWEKFRERDRLRDAMPDKAAAWAARAAEYPKRFPERKAATTAVGNAVRDGRLVKDPCHVCGELKVQAHHADYDRPLDVVWLCVRHHRLAHALVTAG